MVSEQRNLRLTRIKVKSYPTFLQLAPSFKKSWNKSFADATLKDGLSFDTWQSLVFGSAYKIPHLEQIFDTFVPLLSDGIISRCADKLKDVNKMLLSIDLFSDIRSRYLYYAIFFVFDSHSCVVLQIRSERESAENMNQTFLHFFKNVRSSTIPSLISYSVLSQTRVTSW